MSGIKNSHEQLFESSEIKRIKSRIVEFGRVIAIFAFPLFRYSHSNQTRRYSNFPMKDDDIYFFKQLLTEQLETLLGQADLAVHTLIKHEYEISPDLVDRASFESERGTMFRIRDRESKLIRKIQRSLDNLENGSFGICEMCEKEIAIERLKARPVTNHCIECKTKMEALER